MSRLSVGAKGRDRFRYVGTTSYDQPFDGAVQNWEEMSLAQQLHGHIIAMTK